MALPVRSPLTRTNGISWRPRSIMEELSALDHATERLSQMLNELAAPFWPTWDGDEAVFRPPADIEETDDAFVVDIELPGVNRDDLEVEVMGRHLTVTGERKERERAGIIRRRTRTIGRFRYEVMLPAEVDDASVSAKLRDGVLTVTVPKAVSEKQARRRIKID